MPSDAEHPFFRPLWRRVAVVAFCFGWAGLEFYNDSQTWGLIALAAAAYGIWTFFISYKPLPDVAEEKDPDKSD